MIPFRRRGELWDEERLTMDLIYLVEIGLCHLFFFYGGFFSLCFSLFNFLAISLRLFKGF